ncbi:unnamed protein product [Nesidiocoris tenuis]|uniref:S-adenosylmethionine decarboxylase proenzyme n=2 Tax=Nesidiocoris tenuis TaxID=355587 RepID=A0ABN7A5G1_9HEMI|nr:S-adenosylmethionine decarboxylase proenzyme [Nesidiocoris tenuis]CAB0012858.1 unnamed protein product [Nesidiocoris tenuis]
MSITDPDYSTNFFEGVEKLLEIWFKPKSAGPKGDLRNIPRESLESLLKIVHCEIISFSRNDKVDAYVLSESSMFVAERRFILKTCGTTTPLMCLKPLLNLVEEHAGFVEVEEIFYSRKNFKRPDLQKALHRSFQNEVAFLDSVFENGVSFCMGESEDDCWYLYTLQRSKPDILAVDSNDSNNNREQEGKSLNPDQTLEILMTDLDPRLMAIFTKKQSANAEEATRRSGIDTIIPGMKIDDFLFEPCGYSMNGIRNGGEYMTIHITPEPEFSYVSFETNVAQDSYLDVIRRVLDVFKPGKFVLTLFANKASPAADCPKLIKKRGKYDSFGDLELREVEYCRLNNYDLSFAFYSKFPS